MNRRFFNIITILLMVSVTLSWGMVTNTNQSAEYIRLLNRNASTDLDAALFNPAGLTKLEDGIHLYLSNQTIWQTREIQATFPTYNSDTFTGKTFVPAFPNTYFAYKKGKFALSAGFMPIGGGGSADFPDGLPTFDYQLAKLVGLPAKLIDAELEPYGEITGYSVDAGFVGSSIYFACQGNIAYALNDVVSVAFGFRGIYALNTYVGALENAVLNAENGDIAGVIPDMEVDSERTGTAYTAIVGMNIALVEGMNIGFRYEHIARLQVEASTKKDDTILLGEPGMFPDGETYNEDIPAQIGAGASYQLTPSLKAEIGFNYFMNTQCDWDGDEEKVTDDFNTGAGIEYALSEVLTVSAGYLYSTTGAKDEYQSDMDYSLASQTIGGGLKYALNPKTALSLGLSNTFYKDGQNDDVGTNFEEKYRKTAFVVALGIQYMF
ncbi:MAG: hypothetical protein H8D67_12435 [Deltaproteobacteria bacterium]|nr:hypothetical protein [Deltaproteobacteria bacterium]